MRVSTPLIAAILHLLPSVLAQGSSQKYFPIATYREPNQCVPTGYFQAQDLGGGFTDPSYLTTTCENRCTSYGASCAAFVGQLWKAADSGLYSGQCFYYSTPPPPAVRCADHPTVILAEQKDSLAQCFATSSVVATAYCSSYLSLGTATRYIATTTPTSTRSVGVSTTTSTTTTRTATTSTTTTAIISTTTSSTVSLVTTSSTTTTATTYISTTTTRTTSIFTPPPPGPSKKKKRAVATSPAPACVPTSEPAASISSACSALNLKSATVSLTTTAPTFTKTTLSTTTSTSLLTKSTTTTSTIKTSTTTTSSYITTTTSTTLTTSTTTKSDTTTTTTSTTATATCPAGVPTKAGGLDEINLSDVTTQTVASADTPDKCCIACNEDPNCVAWIFAANDPPGRQCHYDSVDPGPDGGPGECPAGMNLVYVIPYTSGDPLYAGAGVCSGGSFTPPP